MVNKSFKVSKKYKKAFKVLELKSLLFHGKHTATFSHRCQEHVLKQWLSLSKMKIGRASLICERL